MIVEIKSKEEVGRESIDLLMEILGQAEKGEIESLAIVTRSPNGYIRTRSTASSDKHHLMAGAMYLLFDLLKNSGG